MSSEASESGYRGEHRVPVTLACSECRARNYKKTKAPQQLLELKKFCKQCKKHTLHRESK